MPNLILSFNSLMLSYINGVRNYARFANAQLNEDKDVFRWLLHWSRLFQPSQCTRLFLLRALRFRSRHTYLVTTHAPQGQAFVLVSF